MIVLFAAGTLFVACGGDDDESATADASTDATVDAGSNGAAEALLGKDCVEAATAYAAAVTSAGQVFAGAGENVESDLEKLQAYADKAPDEIKDDLKVVAEAYSDFVTGYADIDYDATSGKPPTQEQADALEELGKKLDNDEVTAASDNVSAWFDENCKQNG
jgi:hypothetical protein